MTACDLDKSFRFVPAPQIRSTILALYKLVCMYVCIQHLCNRWYRPTCHAWFCVWAS